MLPDLEIYEEQYELQQELAKIQYEEEFENAIAELTSEYDYNCQQAVWFEGWEASDAA